MKCLLLENAIRKYGDKNFIIEVIHECIISELDFNEIKFIKEHKTNIIDFGYNICMGGGGGIGRPVSIEHRRKISEANKKCNTDINIQERKVNNILLGYCVSKNINNIRYTKTFSNKKNLLEKNLDLAKKWLNDIDLGLTVDNNKYNRIIDLPKNISYNYSNSKKLVGYNVKVEYNKKRYIKSFTIKTLSMDEKLQCAIKYKEQLLNNLSKNEEVISGKPEQDNPQPSPKD